MRTPRDHARDTANIMKNVPEHDSEIMPAPRHVEKPRHGALAEQFRPLLEWRRLSNPNSGTWAEPANDNVALTREGFQPGVEAELEQRPSPEELQRAWQEGGPVAAARLRKKDSFGTPKGPDERIREDRSQKAAEQKRLAIEALKFLLLHIEGTPIATPEPRDSNYVPLPLAYETAGKLAARAELDSFGVGRGVSFDDARRRLGLPPVANDNQPAFPWLPSDPRVIFFGCKVRPHMNRTPSGEFNDGVSTAEAERQEFAHLRGKLSKDGVKALDIAVEAQNFTEVGEAFGLQGKAAERQGKQMVLKACAELKVALAGREA